MRAQSKRTVWLLPLLLLAAGTILLLDNFLLIDVDVAPYWPWLLMLAGLMVLVKGDIALSWQAHSFGITRGSVQSGTLEIESGEIDVQIRALRKPGRLIAGQYTARSRPSLAVRNNHAALRLQRGQTWLLSLADWDLGLTGDLPWGLLVSSSLGNLDIDLRGLLIERAVAASGMGTVTVICPDRAGGPISARSTFGDVRVAIPEDMRASVIVKAGPFARVRIDERRYEGLDAKRYLTRDTGAAPTDTIEVTVSTVFGTIYVS